MTSTILIAMVCAVISVVVSLVVSMIVGMINDPSNSPDLQDKFSKLWSRLQKYESALDKEKRFVDGELERMSEGITQNRKVISALTGYVSMDYSRKENHIIAQDKKGNYFMVDLNLDPIPVIALKKVVKKPSTDMVVIHYKDCDLEYKKPVDTTF